MSQTLRMQPGLMISVALLVGGGIVCVLFGLLMARAGASLRPVYWFGGFFALIVLPQLIGHLWLSKGAAKQDAPRQAALKQLGESPDTEARDAAVKALFGPDADSQLVVDARKIFGDAFQVAEFANFATLPNGESVLLARFKGFTAAEKGWVNYLRVSGLSTLGGTGNSQIGYVVTRPTGDRAYALHMRDMVGVWTGADDTAIRARMLAGGFEIPRKAPLAPATRELMPSLGNANSVAGSGVARAAFAPGLPLTAAVLGGYVFIVILYFFKGAAWAGSVPAKAGAAPVSAQELFARLQRINSVDVPFHVEHSEAPNHLIATWRYADARWVDLARARGMRRTFRIHLQLDESSRTARATDYSASYDWSAGRGGANVEWKSSLGIVFFQTEHQRVFGLQMDEHGNFKPEMSYAYSFNLAEMKSPLIEAVTTAGWTWRPTVWQGPKWLRWLTE